jgi:hypothetical protein
VALVAEAEDKLVRLELELLGKGLMAVLVFLLVLMVRVVVVLVLLAQMEQLLHKPLAVEQAKYPQLQAQEFSMLAVVAVEWKMLANLVWVVLVGVVAVHQLHQQYRRLLELQTQAVVVVVVQFQRHLVRVAALAS